MDLETLERCWQTDVALTDPPVLEGTDMNMILRARAADIEQRLRHRLRQEATWYFPTLAAVVASFWGNWSWSRLLWALGFLGLFGGLIGVLWRMERGLAGVRLDGSLRDVLVELVTRADRTGRAYLTAYVVTIIGVVALAGGAVWWRHGAGGWLFVTLVLGAALVAWSYWSGRAYVNRMFRKTRADLDACLRDLDG